LEQAFFDISDLRPALGVVRKDLTDTTGEFYVIAVNIRYVLTVFKKLDRLVTSNLGSSLDFVHISRRKLVLDKMPFYKSYFRLEQVYSARASLDSNLIKYRQQQNAMIDRFDSTVSSSLTSFYDN
jgi:hypothetical protein